VDVQIIWLGMQGHRQLKTRMRHHIEHIRLLNMSARPFWQECADVLAGRKTVGRILELTVKKKKK